MDCGVRNLSQKNICVWSKKVFYGGVVIYNNIIMVFFIFVLLVIKHCLG